MYQSFAPMIPPISAANTASYAKSTLRPSSFRRLATIQPATRNDAPRQRPQLWIVRPKKWSSGCNSAPRLASQVIQGINDGSVDPGLEMEMVAVAAPGAAGQADHLALADLRAERGQKARLVR